MDYELEYDEFNAKQVADDVGHAESGEVIWIRDMDGKLLKRVWWDDQKSKYVVG